MGLFERFPYTNFHEMNTAWIIQKMKELEAAWNNFSAGNALNFADPLLYDASKSYAKNTIVLDANGNAYVSLQAVPTGVSLSNSEYWLMVFDYEAFLEKVNKNFTGRYYRDENRAKTAMAIGDWLTFDDVLCKATAAIAVDDLLEVGTNIVHFTLEDFIKAFMQSADQLIQQYKNDIDASELLYRQQLAQDITNTVASLQAQLDLAISGATVDSEVINARLGADGYTYSTLGDAVRGQLTDLSSREKNIKEGSVKWRELQFGKRVVDTLFHFGTINTSTGIIDPDYPLFSLYSDEIPGNELQEIINYSGGAAGVRVYKYVSGVFDSFTTYGNIGTITLGDTSATYRYTVYPIATNGMSNTTKDVLNDLIKYVIPLTGTNITTFNNAVTGVMTSYINEVDDGRLGADGYTYSSIGNAIRTQISDSASRAQNIKNGSVKWYELRYGYKYVNTLYHFGAMNTNTGDYDNNYPLYSLYSDIIPGSDLQKIMNDTNSVGGVRVFKYVGGSFDSYVNYGNVQEINITDTSADYRIQVFPMATNGNSNSTKEILNSLVKDISPLSYTPSFTKQFTVAKDSSGQFSSIQDAIDAASDGDVIYVKSGQYTEHIINTKFVHVIGEDRYSTLITNTTGEYATPPVWTTQGIWENLLIRAINDGNTTPSQPGFAFHLDSYWGHGRRDVCILRNCQIISDWADAIGSGIEKNCYIEIDNCYVVSVSGSAFKCHGHYGDNGYNSYIRIKNSEFLAMTSGQHGVMIHGESHDPSDLQTIQLFANNCSMTDYVRYSNPVVLRATNYGNSASGLNVMATT